MPAYGRQALNFALFLGIVCCAASTPTMEAGSSIKALTIEDDGGVVDLAPGASFSVTLESNPSTGYSWKVVESAEGHVTALGDSKPGPCPGEPGTGALGAPSCEVFHFKAETAGTGSLKLAYKRWWEKAAPPEKTFTVELRIQ